MSARKLLIGVLLLVFSPACIERTKERTATSNKSMTEYYTEPYRPQFHFTPEEKWMNDPNGLVYQRGIYHLFYQYYPDDIVWGPMHWGHATSADLIHWKHKPIALYPDEHGYIFSGSAVVDFSNTSGLGTLENPALVAIFTYHLVEGETAGRDDFQTQGIAYSLDNGETWVKFEGNPVIGNDGIKDFRDPKVFWDEKNTQWIMSLVAGDHLQLWGSKDLKKWSKLSTFGKDKGAHGGVWECPDLFPLQVEGSDEEKWVLLISINPGAPNGGSGTQYFIGEFDGEKFTTGQTEPKWLDWGTDNYAGVTYNVPPKDHYGTYSNEPGQDRIFIGWMSNWRYATETPTGKWRSAMTIPRKLTLHKIGQAYGLFNYPISNLESILGEGKPSTIVIGKEERKSFGFDTLSQTEVKFRTSSNNFQLKLANTLGETVLLTMSGTEQQFFLDRTNSGKVDFQEHFASVQIMPVADLPDGDYEIRLLIDHSSIEIFINEGQYVLTAQLFPNEKYTDLTIGNLGEPEITLKEFQTSEIGRIW